MIRHASGRTFAVLTIIVLLALTIIIATVRAIARMKG